MPSVRLVGDDVASILEERAAWLEAEMDSTPEPVRANIFLALSEIRAILGDRARAHDLAAQARDLAPSRVLAHAQARALEGDAAPNRALPGIAEAAALVAEATHASLPAAKHHAALLAADALRLAGDTESAIEHLSQVAAAGDIRGVVGRAALGLASDDLTALCAFVGTPEAKPVSDGLTAALRLRGMSVGTGGPARTAEGVCDTLRAARLALEAGDTVGAASRIAEARTVPELASGAAWLAASLAGTKDEGRALAMTWLTELATGGDPHASRVLAARAVEADDPEAARAALALGGFSIADEVALSALLEVDTRRDLDLLPAEMGALSAAVTAVEPGTDPSDEDAREAHIDAHAARVVGSEASRAAARMARLLATGAKPARLEGAMAALRATAPEVAAVLDVELALRDRAYGRVSDLLRGWSSAGEAHGRPADAALVAGLVAERTSDPARALAAYREARVLDGSNELALRAIASLHAATDLPSELNELADELGATVQGALARLEAVIREDSVDDATRTELLDRAHQAAPAIPVASFLAERIALRSGNVDEALRWLDARRAAGADATEVAVDTVRAARLIADADPDGSAARIADAHRQCPNDLALRELYERTLRTAPDDRARYWEAQAAQTTGDSRTLLHVEVAHAYERTGDTPGTLRVTEPAGDGMPLLRLSRERAALEGGEATGLVDQLLDEAKNTTDPNARREAYERLADIDGLGRGDPTSALLWHKTILEDDPTHLPSLRYVEHALLRDGRDDELEPVATSLIHALARQDGPDGGERVAHADLATRLRARAVDGDWDSTFEIAELAGKDPAPSLLSLRLLHAHARVRKDDELLIAVLEQLLERSARPLEMAALRLRLAEAAFRQGKVELALTSLEGCTSEDPGDIVAYRLLAEVRQASGDTFRAAEAHESIARLSVVPAHRLDAWYEAATRWLSDEAHSEQATQALEQAAAIDLAHEDVFSRLSALYAAREAHSDLAALLERRIELVTDPDERVTLEVERGRALLAAGDHAAARDALAAALQERPDHTTALATFGDLSAIEEDWAAAEDAWVRLARLVTSPEEQREIYSRLGDLYANKAVNLHRAEAAFQEVRKRAPDDVRTLERLVDVYRRRLDVTRAVEGQQELIAKATTPEEKRQRTIELALLHEDPGHDERKADQVLEAARREFPTDVVVLRALADLYVRHKQAPALNILLDRAAADTRRSFAAGRFAPALFEVIRTVFELRGNQDAARIVGATVLAIEGKPAEMSGAFGGALDRGVDDLLAPEVLSSGLRTLLARGGTMLDVASPMDLRALGAHPAGPEAHVVHDLAASFAGKLGLAAPRIYISKTVGQSCLPAASDPPSLVVGEALLGPINEYAVAFLVMRAMKLIAAKASALIRTTSTDLAALIPAWLQALVPAWTPQGVNPTALAAAAEKIGQSAPPSMSDDLISMGLEVASQLGTRASTLGGPALAWANRAALLGVGDPNAALDAIAWSQGTRDGAPTDPTARAAWIGRNHEAKDLLIFSVGDAYAEARSRLYLR